VSDGAVFGRYRLQVPIRSRPRLGVDAPAGAACPVGLCLRITCHSAIKSDEQVEKQPVDYPGREANAGKCEIIRDAYSPGRVIAPIAICTRTSPARNQHSGEPSPTRAVRGGTPATTSSITAAAHITARARRKHATLTAPIRQLV
jgi:hypothetical protein